VLYHKKGFPDEELEGVPNGLLEGAPKTFAGVVDGIPNTFPLVAGAPNTLAPEEFPKIEALVDAGVPNREELVLLGTEDDPKTEAPVAGAPKILPPVALLWKLPAVLPNGVLALPKGALVLPKGELPVVLPNGELAKGGPKGESAEDGTKLPDEGVMAKGLGEGVAANGFGVCCGC